MRTFFLVPLLAAVVACGGHITSVGSDEAGLPDGGFDTPDSAVIGDSAGVASDGGTDSATARKDAARPDGAPDTFCTGTSPRLVINGSEVPVMSATGKAIAMDCCNAGELFVSTSVFQSMLVFFWRVVATTPFPQTLDLSTLFAGSFEFDLGCDPIMTSCDAAADRYTSGFVGTLEVAQGSAGYDASYCLSFAESAASPHSAIHNLRLYAPHVATGY